MKNADAIDNEVRKVVAGTDLKFDRLYYGVRDGLASWRLSPPATRADGGCYILTMDYKGDIQIFWEANERESLFAPVRVRKLAHQKPLNIADMDSARGELIYHYDAKR